VAVVSSDVSGEFIALIIRLLRSVLRLLITTNVASSMILPTLMMDAIRFTET
jgi:hypothetical protein